MKFVKEMWKWEEHNEIGWGKWKWKMEGNECTRDEKTWDGIPPLRFKSHEMNLETLVRIDEEVNL